MQSKKLVTPLRTIVLTTLTALAASASTTSHAFSFGDPDGLHGSFDTTISYGASWRAQDRDPTLYQVGNGGTGSSTSINQDDGNLNYDKNKLISSVFKASHDLDLNYGNLGFFARAFYFNDLENADQRTGPAPINRAGVKGVGYTFGPQAHSRIGHDAQVLDAYLRGNFKIFGDRSTQVRLGNQVVSWGESTFIQNSLNSINPIDLARFRTPGSELKEALLPTPMLWLAQEISTNVRAEAFSIFNFNRVRIDPRGSFFSNNDIVSDDGRRLYALGVDQHFPGATSIWLERDPDRSASDNGEFGLALRVMAPTLNNTEFGLYYMNLHNRTPIVSFKRGSLFGGAGPTYYVEYPEDVHLTGLSFSSMGPWGMALQGEYSYRSNMPMQLAVTGALVPAAVGFANTLTGPAAQAAAVPTGTEISGYRRIKMHQAQLTGTESFPFVLGADQLIVVGELGYTRLDLPAGLYFNGTGETSPAGTYGAPSSGAGLGFATRSSWGYVLAASAEYNNTIGGIRLTPRASYSQGVRGVSPTFSQGVKSFNLGLAATYREQWRADLSYTAFFGGRTFENTPIGGMTTFTNTNTSKDRDFYAASLSYSF
jgi:hypothetical protein